MFKTTILYGRPYLFNAERCNIYTTHKNTRQTPRYTHYLVSRIVSDINNARTLMELLRVHFRRVSIILVINVFEQRIT